MIFFKEGLSEICAKTFREVLEDLGGFCRGSKSRDICFTLVITAETKEDEL